MNSVTLIGRLLEEPSTGTSDRGVSWCRMPLRIGGRKDHRVDVVVVAFGSLAQTCERWLCAGRLVGVTGRLGHHRSGDEHCVIAHAVDFLDSPPDRVDEDADAGVGDAAEP